MRLLFLFSFVSIFLFISSCDQPANESVGDSEVVTGGKIPDLTWMEGKWERAEEMGQTTSYEYWTRGESGMEGISFTIQNTDTLYQEQLRIGMNGDSLAYFADILQDGNMVPFNTLSHGDNQVVFHNPEIDFPWKIAYTRNEDSMTVRIAGYRNSQAAFRDLKMKLVRE